MTYVLWFLLWTGVDPRYTVETISLTGAQNFQLSRELVDDIQRLVGQRFDQQALDELVAAVGNELRGHSVTYKVAPGDQPEHVRIVLEVAPRPEAPAASEPAQINVNERYTIEDVQLTGIDRKRLSDRLREDLRKLIGARFSQQALDDILRRLRREVRPRRVAQKVLRGDKPEHVKVEIEVIRRRAEEAALHLSKFLYHSKQGWSAKAIGDASIGRNTSLIGGLVSDGDDRLERYAGIVAGFEAKQVATERVRLRFLFETYHQIWNRATLTALTSRPDLPGIYRTRQNFEPTLVVTPARGLSLTAGASLQLVRTQFPAAHTEAANAAVGGLQYRPRWEDPAGNRHDLDLGYEVRAAGRTLHSDFPRRRRPAEGSAFSWRWRWCPEAIPCRPARRACLGSGRNACRPPGSRAWRCGRRWPAPSPPSLPPPPGAPRRLRTAGSNRCGAASASRPRS